MRKGKGAGGAGGGNGGGWARRYALRLVTGVLAIASLSSVAWAQQAVITGKVVSAGGQPLGGASVGIPELGVGGVADAEGNYTFTLDVSGKAGRAVNVVARYIGYKPKRLPITLAAGRVVHDFTLEKDVLNLEEVVVTGTSEATSQKKTPFAIGVVDNTQIKDVPSSSPLAVISGKVPGASVITETGQPGSAPAIRLRAATSLTGRQDPLIIIDGTISRLSLADVNSEDIERIEIIKGAAASSLYGSDAANGVVQIFTKRGGNLAEAQTSFVLRNELGANTLPNLIETNQHHSYRVMCGAAECTPDQASTNAVTGFRGATRTAAFDLIADNDYPVYFDQQKQVFQPGMFMTNYISIGQRRGTTNYNASFQNQHDAGVLKLLNGYQRENFRLNVDQSLSDHVDVGMGAFYGRSTADQGQDQGIFFGMRFIEPNVKLDSIVADCGVDCPYAGQYNPVIKQPPLSGNVTNPLYILSTQKASNNRDRFSGTFKGAWRPVTWLTGEGNVGYDQASQDYRFFVPVGQTNSGGAVSSGSLFQQSNFERSYNTNVSLTSVRTFGDMVRNTTKLAYLYEDATKDSVSITATQLTVPKVPEFAAADLGSPVLPGSGSETIRAQNVFLVTTFDIKDRYIVDGLVRRDQSSLFGAHERTAVYHRVSGAYRVTEDFAIPGVDELKLRVGHGTAGLRPPFAAQYETFGIVNGTPEKLTIGNADLKPAFSRETEAGFNLNFLTKYSLEYSYSVKRTTDEIMKVPVSATTGYQARWLNAGTLEGHTHEAAFGAILLSKADYFWRLNITGDRTRQTIADLKVGEFLVGPSETDPNTQIFRIAAGQPFGIIYGSRWVKTQGQLEETLRSGQQVGCTDPSTNALHTCTSADYVVNEDGYYVRDTRCITNGDGTVGCTGFHSKTEAPVKAFRCLDAACAISTDKQQIGDVNPDFSLGFNTNAQWKGFGMNATMTWVKGGNIYNYTRQWPFNELRDQVVDQSTKPAAACAADGSLTKWTTQAMAQCPYSTGRKPTSYYSTFYNNFDANEYFVEDGSYLRLRELALNYTVPVKYTSALPLGFHSARLGLVGRNLWTHTKYSGYDPDVTGPGGGNPFAYRVDYFTYPAYRTFTAMVELGY